MLYLDYLQHAECIKEKSTTEVYCGTHYSRHVTIMRLEMMVEIIKYF